MQIVLYMPSDEPQPVFNLFLSAYASQTATRGYYGAASTTRFAMLLKSSRLYRQRSGLGSTYHVDWKSILRLNEVAD